MAGRSDRRDSDALARAAGNTERALLQVTQVVIEQIRDHAEPSHHLDAAERDLRSGLAQLVLAERERSRAPGASRSPRRVAVTENGGPDALEVGRARGLLPESGRT